MFESYFELINNPINKQIKELTRQNQAKTKIIHELLIEQNNAIAKLKTENKNIRQENKGLVRERNNLKVKYNNLKRKCKKIKVKNKTPVPKWTRRDVFKRDNFRCLACGTDENLTLDHIIPRSKGGSNKIDNLQTLCQNCNLAKEDNAVDYRENNIEPLIKRKKKFLIYFNFSEFDTLDIKV